MDTFILENATTCVLGRTQPRWEYCEQGSMNEEPARCDRDLRMKAANQMSTGSSMCLSYQDKAFRNKLLRCSRCTPTSTGGDGGSATLHGLAGILEMEHVRDSGQEVKAKTDCNRLQFLATRIRAPSHAKQCRVQQVISLKVCLLQR